MFFSILVLLVWLVETGEVDRSSNFQTMESGPICTLSSIIACRVRVSKRERHRFIWTRNRWHGDPSYVCSYGHGRNIPVSVRTPSSFSPLYYSVSGWTTNDEAWTPNEKRRLKSIHLLVGVWKRRLWGATGGPLTIAFLACFDRVLK